MFYQHDIITNEGEALLPQHQGDAFNLILSILTFHHLADITKAGKALVDRLDSDNGGTFCLIEFLNPADDNVQKSWEKFVQEMDEQMKDSIGEHDGFTIPFLKRFFGEILGLTNISVEPIFHLKHGDHEFPLVMAWGEKKYQN